MNANDGLLHVGDWGDLAGLLTAASALLALLWWAIRAQHAADRARLTAQIQAAESLAKRSEAAIADLDKRMKVVENTMATHTDLNGLRNDLQEATTAIHVAIEKSSEKTIREVERLLEYALKDRRQ